MTKLDRRGMRLALALALAGPTAGQAQSRGPTVFAAASMKTALDAIAAAWTTKTGEALVVSYGSSGILAKQIAAGAPADLFISADEKWMDVLDRDGAIRPTTRENLLGNALVLVAPAGPAMPIRIEPGFDLARALGEERLAVCAVASCPAGIYAKEALTSLGVWSGVAPKLVQAENVRAALRLVVRGEAKYGIVYATDARAEPKVRVVGTFPESSHAPIVYPVAVTTQAKAVTADAFEAYLRSPEAIGILREQGFTVLPR